MKKKLRAWYQRFLYIKSPPVFDKIAGFSSILGLIMSFISLLGVNLETLWDKNNEVVSELVLWFEKYGVLVNVIAIVLVIVAVVLMAIKYHNLLVMKMNVSAFGLSSIMNKTIEFIDDLNALENDIDKSKCKNCSDSQVLHSRLLNTIFIQYTIAFLDELAEVMSCYVSYDVSSCVKLVVNHGNEDDSRIDDKKVVTLARNSKTNESRKKIVISEPVPINENSDFYDIVSGSKNDNAPYFYVPNLDVYSKAIKEISNGQHIYLNSNLNWREHYIGTVVVPIGSITSKRNKKGYTVWGFLCIDSLEEKAFTMSQKDINVKLLQGFASIYGMAAKEYEAKYKKIKMCAR